MKKKYDLLSLPKEILSYIAWENPSSLRPLTCISRHFNHIFQPQLKLTKLLDCVAKSKLQEAEEILMKFPMLAVVKGNVRDYSGRDFIDVSPIQLAIWTLNVRYMVPLMLKCIDKAPTKEKEIINRSFQNQLKELENNGINYKLEGQLFNEKIFNCNNILGSYLQYFQRPDDEECCLDKLNSLWCNIGAEQWLLPAHFAQHFCAKNPLISTEILSQSLEISIFPDTKSFWFAKRTKENGLGVDFSITLEKLDDGQLYPEGRWFKYGTIPSAQQAYADSKKLYDLFVEREKELNSIKELINNRVQDKTLEQDEELSQSPSIIPS